MRKATPLIGGAVALALAALPAMADNPAAGDVQRGDTQERTPCGETVNRGPDAGYEVIFDGSQRCFARWHYAGGSMITLQRDGTLKAEPGPPNLGVLWYAARPYGDFSLRLEFRDDSPVPDRRANSGVQVRFPAPKPPVPGCPMTFDGNPQTVNPERGSP